MHNNLEEMLHPPSHHLHDGYFAYILAEAVYECKLAGRRRNHHPLFRFDMQGPLISFTFGAGAAASASPLASADLLLASITERMVSPSIAVPFLAHTRRQHIAAMRAKWQRQNRRNYGHRPRQGRDWQYDETRLDIPDPYDLAVLLALAQRQRAALSQYSRMNLEEAAEGAAEEAKRRIYVVSVTRSSEPPA